MYTIDTTTFLHFWQTLWELVRGVLALDPAAFRALQSAPHTDLVTLSVLFLAGVSETLGQSVVLLANRVKPGRFVASLLLSGSLFLIGVLFLISSIWLIGTFIFGVRQPIDSVMREVSIAYAPLLFGFFILLPYMGIFIDHALHIWSLLAILVAVTVTFHLPFWQALLCTIFGWLFVEALKLTLGRPIVALLNKFRQVTAGVSAPVRVQDMPRMISENIAKRPKGGK